MLLARLALASSLLFACAALARPSYVSRVPNGDVNSCMTCHNSASGGSRNPFGSSIAGANLSWETVCGCDADGDGQTNGEELGDPDCLWTSGASPARSVDISLPGDASDASADPTGGTSSPASTPTCSGGGGGGGGEEGELEEDGEGDGDDDDGGGGGGIPGGCATTPFAPAAALALSALLRRRPARRSAARRPS